MHVSVSSFLGAVLFNAGSMSVAQAVVPEETPAAPSSVSAVGSETSTPEAPAPALPAIEIPPNDTSRMGTVKHAQGAVLMGRTPSQQAPVPDDGVRESERLSTGPDGTVRTMGSNTTMDLSRFNFDSTTQPGQFVLDLLRGSVGVINGLLARVNPDLFKVQTPTSVVGVRGTDFIVDTREPL